MKRTLAVLSLALAARAAHAQEPASPPPEQPPAAPPATEAPPPTAPPAPPPSQPAPAQSTPEAAPSLPLGIVVSADLGGGGRLGGGSQYTPRGVFEAEVTAGYELPAGFRPELSVLLGVAPGSYAGLRIGLHYALTDTPFYARAAFDGSTVRGPAAWRWLLAGGGAEVRLTEVLGGFAEADLGLPLSSGSGVPVLVRVGVAFRL